MSVLYKALQKAAKENEEQASAQAPETGAGEANAFDTSQMMATGAISSSRFGKVGTNWRLAGGAAAVVLAVVIGAVFFLGDSGDVPQQQVAQAPVRQAQPSTPPAQPAPVQTAPTQSAPQTPAAEQPAPMQQAQAPAPVSSATSEVGAPAAAMAEAPAPAAAQSAPAPEPAAAPPAEPAAEPQVAEAPAAPAPVRQAKAPAATPTPPEPMPDLDWDSPSRALSPPISVRRAEAEFTMAGDLVQVREVSQSAQDNVTAGYNALVRGDVGTAIDLYTQALEAEPRSIMALLGRSAALQKSGRLEEARVGYENVLRLDPNNLEALSNLTTIFSTRAPNDALNRLLDLENQYPRFSPVKAQIGLIYARMGSTDQALAYLREAVNMSPSTVMYHYNLAILLDRMGRSEQAVASYQRVLAGIINSGGGTDLSRGDIERRVRYLKTL